MKKRGEKQLILYQVGFHASHSPWQEGREDEMMRDFYGPRCYELSENLIQLGFLVKTYLGSLELRGSKYVRNWKVQDTLSPFLIMKLRLSEQHIEENESFLLQTERNDQVVHGTLWLTPTASDGKRLSFSKESLRKSRENGSLSQNVAHNDRGKGKLNPLWVEQLMGFPIEWTEIENEEY